MIYARTGQYYRVTQHVQNVAGHIIIHSGELVYVKRDGFTRPLVDHITVATLRFPELYLQGTRHKRWGIGRVGFEKVSQSKARLEWNLAKL